MTLYTSASGDLTMFTKQGYGGWTVHVREGVYGHPDGHWLHEGKRYFGTVQEAQANAFALAEGFAGHSIDALRWQ